MGVKDINPGIVLIHGDGCPTVEADHSASSISVASFSVLGMLVGAGAPYVLGHFVPPCCLVDHRVATTAANLNPGATGECASSAEPGGGNISCSQAIKRGVLKILPYCDGDRYSLKKHNYLYTHSMSQN